MRDKHRQATLAEHQVYSATAGVYDDIRFEGPAGKWSNQRQLAAIARALPDLSGKHVLELGCGTGRITQALLQAGAYVTGIDASEQMLQVARHRVAELGLQGNADFRQDNIYTMPLDLSKVDVVLTINVVSRLINPQLFLDRISDAIPPRTPFVFSVNSLTSIFLPFGILVNMTGRSIWRRAPSFWYLPGQVVRMCERAGLKIEGWQGAHYVPMPTKLGQTLPLIRLCDRIIGIGRPKLHPSLIVATSRAR